VGEFLGCGPELKNTRYVTKGPFAILSQHIGDLENYETLVFFQETPREFEELIPDRASRSGLRLASLVPQQPVCDDARECRQGRRTASSRAHRKLQGGEQPAGQGE
jgi:hypothetical protein